MFYALAVVNVYVSCLAFGAHVPLETLVVIVPVILIVSMIPISFGGIGLQEWAHVATFAAIGAGGPLGLEGDRRHAWPLTVLSSRWAALAASHHPTPHEIRHG